MSNKKISKAFSTNMSKFFITSISTVIGLYFIFTLFLLIIFELKGWSLESLLITSLIVLIIDFLIAPNLMDWTLNLLYKISWESSNELPEYLRAFLTTICEEKNIKFPKVGIINDGSPNAFTYGRTPNDARIVITRGTINLLTEDELKAVVAHEMGHVVHWDMLLMTVVQFVPVVTYYIYKVVFRTMENKSKRSRSKDNYKSEAITLLIGIIAYVIYIVSEYIVLWFSRVREYYADQFAGEVIGNPNHLASALVQIGYGLKGQSQDDKESGKVNAISALGICDEKTMKTLAVSSYMNTNPTKIFDEQTLKDISRWDLWNPWAGFYEINSTHPLIAKRLKNLSSQSEEYGLEPFVTFDENKPESYWDDFLKDLFIYLFPSLTLVGGFIGATILSIIPFKTNILGIDFGCACLGTNFGMASIIFAIAWLLSLLYTHPNKEYPNENVKSLLKNVKVSAVKPVPCTINGKIIGKGTPGYIFSEDFVIEDETGIIFIDYNQPLAIFNLMFSLLKSKKYIDQNVEVTGWYRRAPIPYIEIKTLLLDGKIKKCYGYLAQIITALLFMVGGLIPIILSIV